MNSWLTTERARFHKECLTSHITETNGVCSIADSSSKISREISIALVGKLGGAQKVAKKIAGQTAGHQFEQACRDFISNCFNQLEHLRPGEFNVSLGGEIYKYDQYAHLDELRILAEQSRQLKTHIGTDYLIKPDIVIVKEAEDDSTINRNIELVDATIAQNTSLRSVNGALPLLHASVSCKLTIRSDRVQNTRSEALNLVRNRKGRLPHIVAVTAEPVPSRLAAIALGTGDIDCVYHFALPELVEVLREQERETLELVETMIEGKRLRDISDLPLDLVI